MALQVAISGVVGVFIGLTVLCICLIIIQKTVSCFSDKKNKIRQENGLKNQSISGSKKEKISGEVIAALAASIYLDIRSFDEKKKLLTIQQVTKPYSPWVNSGKSMMISNNSLLKNRN
ncbi:MAG: OadG family protein [bacterium]|nr:OadG family protein [bacterium]